MGKELENHGPAWAKFEPGSESMPHCVAHSVQLDVVTKGAWLMLISIFIHETTKDAEKQELGNMVHLSMQILIIPQLKFGVYPSYPIIKYMYIYQFGHKVII